VCLSPLRYDYPVIPRISVPQEQQTRTTTQFDVFAKDKGSWRFKCRIPAITAEQAKHKALMDFNLLPEAVTVYPSR